MSRVLNFINEFFKNENGDLNILGKGLKIILVFIVIRVLIKVIYIIIDKTVENRKRRPFSPDEKKVNTLLI